LTREQLNAKHPHYVQHERTWADLDLLFAGGQALMARMVEFLPRRSREPKLQYDERIKNATYHNQIGDGLGHYATLVSEDPPALKSEQVPDLALALNTNFDGEGSTIGTVASRCIVDVALLGCVWMQPELPAVETPQPSRGQQQATGELTGYVLVYSPLQVTNWSTGRNGLDWVVITGEELRSTGVGQLTKVKTWRVFDRQNVSVYEAKDDKEPLLTMTAPHLFAERNEVPIKRIAVDRTLWLGDRLKPLLLEHLRQTNSFSVALGRANVAIPWIKGRDNSKELTDVAEQAYLNVASDGEVGYLEPSGKSFEITAQHIERLREQIARMLKLQAQSRSADATANVQSGFAKELDLQPSRALIRDLARHVRSGLEFCANSLFEAYTGNAESKPEIAGFSFDDGIQDELTALSNPAFDEVDSPTFQRERQIRIANTLGPFEPAKQESIENEILSAPTADQRRQAAISQGFALAGEASNV
jgi:hypothetical protein